MDSLTYHYAQTAGRLDNNKLVWIKDKISQTRFSEDLDNQSQNNYLYDQIGNLIHDQANGLDTILWNVYGKVKSVIPISGLGKQHIDFFYDATGNRLYKSTYNQDSAGARPNYQFYARDAQGNILSVYSLEYNELKERWELKQKENHLYGSSRLGIEKCDTLLSFYTSNTNPLVMADTLQHIQDLNQSLLIAGATAISGLAVRDASISYISYIDYLTLSTQMSNWAKNNGLEYHYENGELYISEDSITFISMDDMLSMYTIASLRHVYVNRSESKRELGNKQFELTNHLGNVISTVSDRKLAVEDIDSLLYVQYYAPQIVSAQDYYSFGMMMPGRGFSIEDTTAQRIDTVADNPLADHFESGIDGWYGSGTSGQVSWDSINQRLILSTVEMWDDEGRKVVNTVSGNNYTLSCDLEFPDDYVISLCILDPLGGVLAWRYIYNWTPMPATLNFTANNTSVTLAFGKTAYDGTPSDFYIDDVVITGDSVAVATSVRVPLASYPFGFNGKENDNEVYGLEGTFQDYGMRVYDPRIGRFLSVDPLSFEFPWNSPYSFSENSPILYIDLDGGERKNSMEKCPDFGGAIKPHFNLNFKIALPIKIVTKYEIAPNWEVKNKARRNNRDLSWPVVLKRPEGVKIVWDLYEKEDKVDIYAKDGTRVGGTDGFKTGADSFEPDGPVDYLNIKITASRDPDPNDPTKLYPSAYEVKVESSEQVVTKTQTKFLLGIIPIKREKTKVKYNPSKDYTNNKPRWINVNKRK